MKTGAFFSLFRLHVYRDRVGGEGGFLENTIRMNLPKGLPLGFGEICVDFWDFWRGVPEPLFYYYWCEFAKQPICTSKSA